MELIAALLFAGPLGYFAPSPRTGLVLYLVLWAVVFPVQTVVVLSDSGNDPLYWLINAGILGLGIGLNRLGSHLRANRTIRAAKS